MPSPLGHSLAGLAIGEASRTTVRMARWKWYGVCVLGALAADLDFIPGLLTGDINRFHHSISHSLGSVALFGIGFGWAVRRVAPQAALVVLIGVLLYASHVALDFFAADTRPPEGIPLLWPLTGEYFVSPVTPFAGIHHGVDGDSFQVFAKDLLSRANIRALAIEFFLLVPVWLVVLAILRRHRQGRTAARGGTQLVGWLGLLILPLGSLGCDRADVAPLTPPYPESPVIERLTFDWSSYESRAPGSDNWPITWGRDDHQYTSWGDGGGFGGSDTDGRVSLGIARVEGSPTSYSGYNVRGGKNAAYPVLGGGKSYGIVSIEGVLYMWRSPGSNTSNYRKATLWHISPDGTSWSPANWDYVQADSIVLPTFLQFGKDYAGARDSYVYSYAVHLKDASSLQVQKPGEIALMRAPKKAITDRTAYEFFGGIDAAGQPVWVRELTHRQPVFENPEGVGWTLSVSYNAGLDRYLLITEHTKTMAGNIGIYDAPEPWGPWTTVVYERAFGAPTIDANTFFWNFSNKWLSTDGRDLVLIFTGIESTDAWNVVRGTLTTW